MLDAEVLDNIEDVIVNQYGEDDGPFTLEHLTMIIDTIVEFMDKRVTRAS